MLAAEVVFLSMGNFTLDRSVEQLVLLSEHVSDSFKGLTGHVRRDVTGHTHLASSELPDMQVVVTADGVAGVKNISLQVFDGEGFVFSFFRITFVSALLNGDNVRGSFHQDINALIESEAGSSRSSGGLSFQAILCLLVVKFSLLA